jgi:hypothetical protein
MAVCTFCEREMTDHVSCTVHALHRAGVAYRVSRTRKGCGDCGAPPGGLHHPGCDMQRCPRCRWQLISCECRFDEMPGYDEDDEGYGPEDRVADLRGALAAVRRIHPER